MPRSTPRFTRRDYEFIADKIAPHLSWATAIKYVADELKATNRNFNYDKFVERAERAWEENYNLSKESFDDEIPY